MNINDSRNVWDGDGVTDTFTFSLVNYNKDYNSLEGYVIDEDGVIDISYTWSLDLTGTQVVLNKPLEIGKQFVFQVAIEKTPKVFYRNAKEVLNDISLNTSIMQVIDLALAVMDHRTNDRIFRMDMNGQRISNMGTAEVDSDAISLGQVKAIVGDSQFWAGISEAQATIATTKAAEASQSALDAADQVVLASDQVTLAAGQVTLATTQADNAEQSAIDAATSVASILTGAELGSIIPFIIDTLPQGYLECNGATVQATTYPELVEYLNPGQSSAILPDLRGEFVRGYDNGKGVDTGRILGTSQDDSFESHDHFIANTETSGIAITDTTHVTKSGSIQGPGDDEYSLAGTSTEPTLGLTSSTGDIETRPRNIALKYGIKAFSTTDNSGSVDLEGLAQDVIENAGNITDLQSRIKVLVTGFLNTGASGTNPVISGMNIISVARIAVGRYRITHTATVTNIGVSSMSFESTAGTHFNTTLERRGTTETDIYTRGYSTGTAIDIDSARIDFALIER